MSAKSKTAASSNGNVSLRDRIRQREAKGELLKVEEWGETVELRSMTIEEKAQLVQGNLEDAPLDQLLPSVVILTCFDPDSGERLFSEDDREWLVSEPAGVMEKVALKGMTVSGVTAGALEEGKGGS